jgi:hypothetical protein
MQLLKAVSIALVLALTAGRAGTPDDVGDIDSDILSGGRVQGVELDRRVAAAQAFPLGSRQNPVRVAIPPGQRAYLARLRCPDGQAPAFERTGNLGPGV